VQAVASTAAVPSVTMRRTDRVPSESTSGIAVCWTDMSLLRTLQGSVYRGRWLNGATARYPAVVLGWVAPEIDRSALIGLPAAEDQFLASDSPDTVYVRSAPDQVLGTQSLLPRAANPEHPEQVNVSRPSDALAARAAAQDAFTSLFVGLGAVALLVGGVGIANVMVISVLERRSEIGLRRALGATRALVAVQFLSESMLLSLLGGLAGVALGAAATAVYAPVAGGLGPPWSSARRPASTRPAGRPACRRRTRCGRCEPSDSLPPGGGGLGWGADDSRRWPGRRPPGSAL
jgi:hypothetical protein